ncbi:DNA polymerase delta, subunit 4-domain-containing protein [Lenzites betulinus]|nr:DNA polymerase delta, subunit 4-domain-containing protein [Lenzites betulinus]
MPARKNSKPAPAMKQARLSFASKRNSSTASAAAGKGKAKTTPKPTPRVSLDSSPASVRAISISDSESEVSFNDDYVIPVGKKHRLAAVPRTGSAKRARTAEEEDADEKPQPELEKETLDLSDKRWRKQYGVARGKMDHLEPVHGQGQSMVHHILRVFDLSYEYGPCVGVPRIDRWERAQALGLNPPLEVKEILLTHEGSTNEQFSQSVFHNEV